MKRRKFIHSPSELIKQGKAVIFEKNEHKYAFRVTMVLLLLSGSITSPELSEITGVPRRTLSTWVKKADESGFESLKAKKQPGRPNRLTENELATIKDAIKNAPEEAGYRVWDGSSLSDYILKKFNVKMGVRQCQRLFRKLGFSLIRAQTFPSAGEQNEEERTDFKKN